MVVALSNTIVHGVAFQGDDGRQSVQMPSQHGGFAVGLLGAVVSVLPATQSPRGRLAFVDQRQ